MSGANFLTYLKTCSLLPLSCSISLKSAGLKPLLISAFTFLETNGDKIFILSFLGNLSNSFKLIFYDVKENILSIPSKDGSNVLGSTVMPNNLPLVFLTFFLT